MYIAAIVAVISFHALLFLAQLIFVEFVSRQGVGPLKLRCVMFFATPVCSQT